MRLYHALFQLAMILSGMARAHLQCVWDSHALQMRASGESSSWEGRADAVLNFSERIYVVEIKHAPNAEGLPAALATGMEQIHQKQYHKPYLGQGKAVHLLALAFTRGQVSFAEELLNA